MTSIRALLLVHGMVCNGGPNHAADSCEPAEITAAAQACRYFGLDALAALMLELPAAASGYEHEDVEDRLSAEYYGLVPEDSTISDAFEARYAEAPEDFDPITERTFPRFGLFGAELDTKDECPAQRQRRRSTAAGGAPFRCSEPARRHRDATPNGCGSVVAKQEAYVS